MDPRLQRGHFVKFLGAKAGSDQGGMEKMYEAIQKESIFNGVVPAQEITAMQLTMEDIEPAGPVSSCLVTENYPRSDRPNLESSQPQIDS